MALKLAIHSIVYTDPKTGERAEQAPGGVFEVSDEDAVFLENAGAVRDPDERELALHKLASGALVEKAAEAPAEAPKAKTEKAADKADDLVG